MIAKPSCVTVDDGGPLLRNVLSDLMDEGIITPPKYVPPQFADIAAVSAWMVYSLFLNQLDLRRLAVDFKGILQ